jgi:hypothetical protein
MRLGVLLFIRNTLLFWLTNGFTYAIIYTYTNKTGAEMRLMFDPTELFTAMSTPLVILGAVILVWALGCVAVMFFMRGGK